MTKTKIVLPIFLFLFIFLPYTVPADSSDLIISIDTHNVPVIIQAAGGNVDYTIEIVNNGASSLNFDVWTGLTLPNGTAQSPIFGPQIFILPGGWTAHRIFSQYVPSHYLPGNYTYTVYAGIYPGTIWAADSFQFEKETDTESRGWTQQNYDNPYPVLQGVYFTDPNNGWIVGSRDEIIHTTDGGDNWYNQVSPTSSNYTSVFFIDSNNGWAAGSNGKIIHTENGGEDWILQYTVSGAGVNDIFFTDINTGWAVGGKSVSFTPPRVVIAHTTDGGNTWTTQYSESNISPLQDVFFIDSHTGWASGSGGIIFSTTDGGVTWNKVNTGVTVNTLNGIWFTDQNNGWIAGTGGTIIHTTDGGRTWIQLNLGTTQSFSGIIFASPFEGWISGGEIGHGTVLYTNDGGTTWSNQDTGDADYLYDIYFTDTENGWAIGLYSTLIHTENGGQ